MRLLFIVPYAPTPIRTRPYHLLKELSGNGHSLTLATLYADANERQALAQWRAAGIDILAASLSHPRAVWNLSRAVFTPAPLQAAYCWQPRLMQLVTQALADRSYDVIHVEHLRGAWYGIRVQEQLSGTANATPVVWDSVDCISRLFEQTARLSSSRLSRRMAGLELLRTRAYEGALVRQFDRTLVVSETERAALCELVTMRSDSRSTCGRISVVPNGVDLEYFASASIKRQSNTILFSGKMSYHANVTAAFYLVDQVMPRVWETLPAARVLIVGQHPPASLVQRRSDRVVVTGYVPDLRPYLQGATAACAPLRYGAGIQNKVLEAMACATPVVATPEAVAALTAQPESDVLVGEDAAQLSAQLLRILTDESLGRAVGENGRRYVERAHRWGQSTSVLESVYAQAVQGAAGGGEKPNVHNKC